MQPQRPDYKGEQFHKDDTQETKKVDDSVQVPDFDALDIQPQQQLEVQPSQKTVPPPQQVVDSTTASPQANSEVQKPPISASISDVSLYSGYAARPTNQIGQVGFLVDVWADLIAGYGNQAETFWGCFHSAVVSRSITNLSITNKPLLSTGFFAMPYRNMVFFRRNPVTITVYIAKQGRDLYVSWRAFLKSGLDWNRVILFMALGLLFGFTAWNYRPLGDLLYYPGFMFIRAIPIFYSVMLIAFLHYVVFVGGFLAVLGFIRRSGDVLAYFRSGINELHLDDTASLTSAIHMSIIEAADRIGVDTTKLETREPFYKERKKRRF